MAHSRKRVPPARELVAGRCGRCHGSILFEVAPSTPPRADWLCRECSGRELLGTRAAVALRLSLRRRAFEQALEECPKVPRDLGRACLAVGAA